MTLPLARRCHRTTRAGCSAAVTDTSVIARSYKDFDKPQLLESFNVKHFYDKLDVQRIEIKRHLAQQSSEVKTLVENVIKQTSALRDLSPARASLTLLCVRPLSKRSVLPMNALASLSLRLRSARRLLALPGCHAAAGEGDHIGRCRACSI